MGAMRPVLFLLAFVPAVSSAGEFWAVLTTTSYHFNRSASLNENNVGVGAEYSLSDNNRLIAGEFNNSYDRTSFYGGATLLTNQWTGFRLAASLGFLSGYENVPGFVLPAIVWEGDRFGANLIYFPKCNTCSKTSSSGIALQLKARF